MCYYITSCAFFSVQMSSLKWLRVWGMVNYPLPNAEDSNKWSRGMKHVLDDPKGRHYLEQYTCGNNISLPRGECTHFQNFTFRPITCNFK